MRIALTHNLRISDSEEEAEFDTRETVDVLAGAMERLGHRVERIEVSGPASRTVARLEAFGPDLVFNTAEGRRGRFREAFFPALFDELGMPYTGSDAYALSLTLDKQLTKLVLAQHGIPTPRWQYVEDPSRLQVNALRYPVIVKPNFEGSSKGITQDSVVEDPLRLHEVVSAALARYPAGVLVEEFVVGRDVTVPFLEAAAAERGGVLQPVEYVVDPAATASRRYAIYDYELKTKLDGLVSVRAPAKLKRSQAERIQQVCESIYRVLGIRDLGRIDLRLGDDGQLAFLEINALPSLEAGAGIYAAAALEGLHADAVIGAVIQSASARWGLVDQRARRGRPRRTERLKVGFTFNVKRVTPDAAGEQDEEAEYDSPKTLQAIREAIASYGHEVVDLEATQDLPLQLLSTPVDVVFNIAEGFKGRSRESQVPSLLELLDVPYTGSDPAALSVSLDKALAKRMVRTHGILTPDYLVLLTGKERIPRELGFPLLVKPVAEGTSKGVTRKSIVKDENELRGGGARDDREVPPARPRRAVHRRARVHGRAPRRAAAAGAAAHGDRVPRSERPDAHLLLRHEAGLVEGDPLRGAGEALGARARAAGARRARDLHRPRLPGRRPGGLPHGRGGPDLLHRVQPAARAHPRLVGPRPHRAGGGHRLPRPHRRDPVVRHPAAPGARARARAGPARAGGGGARGAGRAERPGRPRARAGRQRPRPLDGERRAVAGRGVRSRRPGPPGAL